jgi:hypothetical protein
VPRGMLIENACLFFWRYFTLPDLQHSIYLFIVFEPSARLKQPRKLPHTLGADNSHWVSFSQHIMSNSKKRSSPGADTTKNGDPFTDVDIGDAEESILTEYQKKIQRVELILGGPHLFVFYDHMSALSLD